MQDKDKFIVEYALYRIDSLIGLSSYEVTKIIPKEILENLPTEQGLNLNIDSD